MPYHVCTVIIHYMFCILRKLKQIYCLCVLFGIIIGVISLHGSILSVSEDFLSELLCIHNVDIETFVLHELILCAPEALLSELLCVHNVGMETYDLHGLILCASVGVSSELF